MNLDPIAVAIGLFGAFAIGAAGLAALQLGRRREEVLVERILDPVMAPPTPVMLAPSKASQAGGWIARVAGFVGRLARPGSIDERSRIRARLICAGFRSERAVPLYLGSKVALAFGLLIIALWANSQRIEGAQPTLLLSLVTFAAGFYLPDAFVSTRTRARQTVIERGLPDGLDLLVTCVEAGLGLDAALQRVSGEVHRAWPILGQELATTFLEIKAGMPRVEAFRRLAGRTGVKDLRSLSATLTQTEIFGTSIALALRIQAEGIRTRRMQRAEEKAGYAAVKMTIPLVICILPALLAIVAGPALVNIVTILPTLTRSVK